MALTQGIGTIPSREEMVEIIFENAMKDSYDPKTGQYRSQGRDMARQMGYDLSDPKQMDQFERQFKASINKTLDNVKIGADGKGGYNDRIYSFTFNSPEEFISRIQSSAVSDFNFSYNNQWKDQGGTMKQQVAELVGCLKKCFDPDFDKPNGTGVSVPMQPLGALAQRPGRSVS